MRCDRTAIAGTTSLTGRHIIRVVVVGFGFTVVMKVKVVLVIATTFRFDKIRRAAAADGADAVVVGL